MTPELKVELGPFGGVCCEHEVSGMDNNYRNNFFDEAAFNGKALHPKIRFVVGRRGSGKSSLGQLFKIAQAKIGAKARFVWDEIEKKEFTDLYKKEFEPLVALPSPMPEIANARFAKIWEAIIWALLFNSYKENDLRIRLGYHLPAIRSGILAITGGMKAWLKIKNHGDEKNNHIAENMDKGLTGFFFAMAREAVLEHAHKTPIIIALDTLEKYSLKDASMNVLAAQIEAVSDFHRRYPASRIQIKVFLASEVFIYVKKKYLLNTLKSTTGDDDTLYLHWRPEHLLQLICWRFSKYLLSQGKPLRISLEGIDWSNYDTVFEKVWVPYFGHTIMNGYHTEEESFPYVLRHTQLRPRQLIMLCNAIAGENRTDPPRFCSTGIRVAIKNVEEKLVGEVFNSYEYIYPDVIDHLQTAFQRFHVSFKGKELEAVLLKFNNAWSKRGNIHYSLEDFMKMVAELGIVGRAERKYPVGNNGSSSIIEAEFEYARQGRLHLGEDDDCVIHPMFFHFLGINIKRETIIVYPFLSKDHPNDEFLRVKVPSTGESSIIV